MCIRDRRRDADKAEKHHVRFGDASDMLASMRRKQQLHSGDRSHPFIRKLDALTPTLSYDGWEEDALRTAHRMAYIGPILRGVQIVQ